MMEWIDGNLDSKVTMKYPAVYMMGPKAHGEILSIAFAGSGQLQGTAQSRLGCAAHQSSSSVVCDALLLDNESHFDIYSYIEIEEDDAKVGHKTLVSRIGEEQLFYLRSRGIDEGEAAAMVVGGFIEPLVKELQMEDSIG